MLNTKLAKDILTEDEGLRLKPYRCPAGALTIGVGRNLDAAGISVDEADLMLTNDIRKVTIALESLFPVFDDLNPARQLVLVNMAFNLGVNGLFKFKKFLAALQAADYTTAAAEMMESTWAKQVPNRSARLQRIMLTGEYIKS